MFDFSDIIFLVSLTSSVFIINEIKKFFERQMSRRRSGAKQFNKFGMDFVWHLKRSKTEPVKIRVQWKDYNAGSSISVFWKNNLHSFIIFTFQISEITFQIVLKQRKKNSKWKEKNKTKQTINKKKRNKTDLYIYINEFCTIFIKNFPNKQ